MDVLQLQRSLGNHSVDKVLTQSKTPISFGTIQCLKKTKENSAEIEDLKSMYLKGQDSTYQGWDTILKDAKSIKDLRETISNLSPLEVVAPEGYQDIGDLFLKETVQIDSKLRDVAIQQLKNGILLKVIGQGGLHKSAKISGSGTDSNSEYLHPSKRDNRLYLIKRDGKYNGIDKISIVSQGKVKGGKHKF